MKEITLDATIENVRTLTDLIDEWLESLDCSMKAQMQIDVAIDEIFSNIANYAYKEGAGLATVSYDFSDGKAVISFKDSGTKFNPLEKEEPDVSLSVEEREIGGLGIFIVKKTMDEVKYAYVDGENVLTIVKTI